MDADESSRLDELFHCAADLPPAERVRFLEENCASDPTLREQIERLLSSDADASREFLQPASRPDVCEKTDGDPFCVSASELPRIGRYTLVRKIGEGGMGVVYEAQQDHPSRKVAIKIIRPGMASPGLIKRFTHEAQILGQLQHPGIACVYEAGAAEVRHSTSALTGQFPSEVQFFAMEFVSGTALTEYAADHKLSTRERLELFTRICDAVQHAHQKGVIHRDLKPANILVVDEKIEKSTSQSDFGGPSHSSLVSAQPKILDFGVARLTDSDVQAVTLQTDVGQLIGTVPYMSPEQVLGDSRLLDVRSDVYTLGVILFELLAGRLPLDLNNRSIPEASRIIREEEPSRLSSVDTQYRGDIETIVAKAIEKDRERRYGSAADLAADVRRFLRVEPILARPASAAYRFRKFARRNKVLVASSAVILVVLVAGIIGTSIGLVRARREAGIARRESAISRAVTEFLNKDLLAAVAPGDQGKDVSMRQVLDEAAKRVEGRFTTEPDVEAAVRLTLGETFLRLGVLEAAEAQLTRAYETRLQSIGPDHADTRTAKRWLIQLRMQKGLYAEAERELRDLLELDRRASGPDDKTCMTDMHDLAQTLVYQGRLKEAEQMHREVLEIKRRVLGEEAESTLLSYGELGAVLLRLHRFDEAAPILERNLAAQRRRLGNEHPHTIFTLNSLAVLKREMGRLDDAESLFVELLDKMKRVFGPENYNTLFVSGDLCTLYKMQGRLSDAERYGVATLEGLARVLGPEHAETVITMEKLADVYAAQERWEQAESLCEKALEISRRTHGVDHPYTLTTEYQLARFYDKHGRLADAEAALAALVDRAKRSGNPRLRDYQVAYGGALTRLSRYKEAEDTLLRAVDAQSTSGMPDARPAAQSNQALIELYEAWGKPEQAEKWRTRLTASQPSDAGTVSK